MKFNTTGIGSILLGLLVLAVIFFASFYSAHTSIVDSLAAFIVNGLVIGGLAWIGMLLVIVGVFILLA